MRNCNDLHILIGCESVNYAVSLINNFSQINQVPSNSGTERPVIGNTSNFAVALKRELMNLMAYTEESSAM